MRRNIVTSTNAPKAIGPYSQANWARDLLFLSGQTPIDPSSQNLVKNDIALQTERTFDNLESVWNEAGLSMDDVIKCNVYLTSMKNFSAMNEVYKNRFSTPYPSRTTLSSYFYTF